ncbi:MULTISPECIES: AI-2E family transporter [unclassified Agromyces]|uniref:AI-2E family transporter n=1 Tax=unclassified Agromyces TaxID=2639701 RepID=UPI00301481F6
MLRDWWHRRAGGSSRPVEDDPSAGAAAPQSALPRATVILLGLASAAVVVFGLSAARGVVAPVLLALVLTICVHPVRRGLERRGVPRGLATGSAIVAVFALLSGFFAALFIALAQFTALLPQFADEIEAGVQRLSAGLEAIGFDARQAETIVGGLEPSRAIEIATGFLGGVTGIVFSLVIVLTLLILMAMDATYGPAILRQLEPRRPALVVALTGFTANVRRYMVMTTALGITQGVINWLALLLLQVPGALLWGLLSFICSFIPNVGYFIAIIPPIVFGLLAGGWPTVVAVIVVYAVVNAVVQSIIQPKVVGGAVRLSETITFVSVLFWALVLGPVGAILAVPLTLLARAVLIDADPSVRWWRPATGDVRETKAIATAMTAEARAQNHAKRAARAERRRAK